MKKQGILFDLDGTLWEVTDTTYKSANEIAKRHELEEISRETICKVMGLNKYDSAKLYFPDMQLEEALKLIAECSILNIENLRKNGGNIYPELENVLKELKENYELFIVSNTGHTEYIEAFLSSSRLGKYFTDYKAASALNITKAEAIRKVIEENSLEKAVYIGDTIKDKEATELAEIPFIQAKYGFGEDLKSKYYINSVDELPSIVKKVLAD